MKSQFPIFDIFRPALALSMACASAFSGNAVAQPPVNVGAASWLVLDGESGQTLGEDNADAERQPASLTKMMTAYVVLNALKHGNLRWDERVFINQTDVSRIGRDEAKMYLVPGQQVSVKTLVRGLVSASANDAALVLAERVGGSLEGFERIMNTKALELGMRHTHFSTPSGITTPGNYSTARDLSSLALRLTKDFPEYYSFSSEKYFKYGKFEKRNKNWLLEKDPTVDGMKTGHTDAAGYCIVATAKRKQASPPMMRRVFVVVLGAPTAPGRIAIAGSLLNFGFSMYQDYPIVDENRNRVVTRETAPKPAQVGQS